MKDINKFTSDLINKEGELSSLSKKASKSLSEFETNTDKYIKFLHTARDNQVKYIRLFFLIKVVLKVLKISCSKFHTLSTIVLGLMNNKQ